MAKVHRKRSGRSKGAGPDEDHYNNKWKNITDDLKGRARRKAGLQKSSDDAEPETVRVKGSDRKFLEKLKQVGEKLPGCGSILLWGVPADSAVNHARELTEKEFDFELEKRHRGNFYLRAREAGRKSKRHESPGLVRETITSYPPNDSAVKAAVRARVFSPSDFKSWLASALAELPVVVEKATCYPGAKGGLQVELIVIHLEQGVIHIHPYMRDCPKDGDGRLGRFGPSGKNLKPRIILASLAPGLLGAWRWRKDGLDPIPKKIPAKLNDDGSKRDAWICEDWKLLDGMLDVRRSRMGAKLAAEAKKASIEPSLPWDVVVADWWDNKFAELRKMRPDLEPFFVEAENAYAIEHKAKIAAARVELGLDDSEEMKHEKQLREKAEEEARELAKERQAALERERRAIADAAEKVRVETERREKAVAEADARATLLAVRETENKRVAEENSTLANQLAAFTKMAVVWAGKLETLIQVQAHVLSLKKPTKEMMEFLRLVASPSSLVPYEVKPEVKVFVEALAMIPEYAPRALLAKGFESRMGLRKFSIDELEEALVAVTIRAKGVVRKEDDRFFSEEFEARLNLHKLSSRKRGALNSHNLADAISKRLMDFRELERGGRLTILDIADPRAREAVVRAQKEVGEMNTGVELRNFLRPGAAMATAHRSHASSPAPCPHKASGDSKDDELEMV